MKKISLILITALLFFGCAGKTVEVGEKIQKAYLYDGTKQMRLVNDALKLNKETVYAYDTQLYGRDDWNPDAIFDVLKKQHHLVQVDCEDTMFMLRMRLFMNGFPADQMYYTFVLVPSDQSDVTGVMTNWGGHALLIVEVEGFKPFTLEMRDHPIYLIDAIQNLKYYFVAVVRTDKNLQNWQYIDHNSYEHFMRGDYTGAIRSKKYQSFIKYAQKIYHRRNFE